MVVGHHETPTPNRASPMTRLSFTTWIRNAAAAVSGVFGATTQQARVAGCSRQTVYHHAHKVQAAVAECHGGGPTRDEIRQRLRLCQDELQQLYDYADTLCDFPPERHPQFAATASAYGLSTSQIATLLAIVLPPARAPSRSTVDRWLQAAQKKRPSSFRFLIERANVWSSPWPLMRSSSATRRS